MLNLGSGYSTSGFISILFILFCNPKELYLTGYSWYIPNLKTKYITEKSSHKLITKTKDGMFPNQPTAHMNKKEPKIIYELLKKLPNIRCDDNMTKILKDPDSWFNK